MKKDSFRLALSVFSCATFLCALICIPAQAKDPRPNIVLVLVDDLGWADLGCYGSQYHKSPNTDRLAAEGMRFTQAYAAAPVCSPTRAALMTGKWPARLHITDWLPGPPTWDEEPLHRLAKPKTER